MALSGGRYWTRELVLDAIRAWAEEHDGRPPRARDWHYAGYGHPCEHTVYALFGSWSEAIRGAGFEPRPLLWSKDRIAEAMLDFLAANGRWPTMRDWLRKDRGAYPHTNTVLYLFGTWSAAKEYAGCAEPKRTGRAAPYSALATAA